MKRPSANVIVLLCAALLTLLAFLPRLLEKNAANGARVNVYVNGELYETLAFPDEGETQLRVETEDGGFNLIAVDSGGVFMADSNCPHRDCVSQGRVSEENAESRALGRWIICMPHRVSVELTSDG